MPATAPPGYVDWDDYNAERESLDVPSMNGATVTTLTRPERRTTWTAAELMALEFPPPRWAVPGLLAEGLNLMAGAPKLGKSWLLLGLGVAVASGGKALGKTDVERGDVLYLALEDPGRRLQDRLGSVLNGDPGPEGLRLVTECEPMPAGGGDRIRRWLDKAENPRLVMIDTLAKVRGTVPDRANRYDADYAAIGAVKAIADEYGVCVLVAHHTRKASAEDYVDSVSGTNGIAGSADAILVLQRSRGSASAILKVTGRDIEEAEHALEFTPDLGTWSLLDGPVTDYVVSDTRRRIVSLIRDAGRMSPKEVADALGISHDNARQACARMAKADQLETDGDGNYRCHTSHLSHVTPPSDRGDRCDTPHMEGTA